MISHYRITTHLEMSGLVALIKTADFDTNKNKLLISLLPRFTDQINCKLLKSLLKAYDFDSGRFEASNMVMRSVELSLTCTEICALLKIYDYDSYRIKMMKLLRPTIKRTSIGEFGSIISTFDYDNYKKEAVKLFSTVIQTTAKIPSLPTNFTVSDLITHFKTFTTSGQVYIDLIKLMIQDGKLTLTGAENHCQELREFFPQKKHYQEVVELFGINPEISKIEEYQGLDETICLDIYGNFFTRTDLLQGTIIVNNGTGDSTTVKIVGDRIQIESKDRNGSTSSSYWTIEDGTRIRIGPGSISTF